MPSLTALPRSCRLFAAFGAGLALAGSAGAQTLETFAGSLDLPFAFHVFERRDQASNGVLEFSASQNLVLVIDSGPRQGSTVNVHVEYVLPAGGGDARLRALLQPPGMHIERTQVAGGRTFRLLAAARPGTDATALLVGALDGAALSLRLDGGAVDAATRQALSGFELDFASILAARTHFDAAAGSALNGTIMHTPVGELRVPGLAPHLYSASSEFDASGAMIAARHVYSFSRAGFWASDVMTFASACGLRGGREALARLARIEPESPYARVVWQGVAVPDRVAALPATRYDVREVSTRISLRRQTEGSRWVAGDGDAWYAFDYLSNDGAAFAAALRAQIDARPLACAPQPLLVLDPLPSPRAP